MDTDKAYTAFIEKCGTVEDYGGDKKAWRQDFGLFCIGWIAAEKSGGEVRRYGFSFKWFDLWIGFYYDRAKNILYCCPLPCCVLWIKVGEVDTPPKPA